MSLDLYAVPTERWSRGCGSGGIGPSGGIAGDGYRYGVLEANWNEDVAVKEQEGTAKTNFSFGYPPRTTTTQQESFNEHGKTGEDLAYVSQRQDRELNCTGQPRDVTFNHGSFLQPPMNANATLNSLAHCDKQLGEPGVQAYLWSGNNTHDRYVPTNHVANLSLTATKRNKWTEESDPYNAFKTTSRTATHAAAVPAAEGPVKRGTIKPSADGGQLAQVGRKPVGIHQQECEKNYRRMGLRDTYATFLTTPKQ